MNYLFEIISRADNELIKRVYMAQKESPSKGDFINLVKADFDFIGVTFDEAKFCQMGQIQFKNFIHKKIFAAAFEEFRTIQAQHSKVQDIPYQDLSLQKYLKCQILSKADCDLLMALRSHCVRGIKANFSSINREDMTCPLKCEASSPEDTQIHLMTCKSILARLNTQHLENAKDIQYSGIYGDIHSQKAAVRHLSSLLDTRRTILEEFQTTPVSTSGPSLVTAPRACQGSNGD